MVDQGERISCSSNDTSSDLGDPEKKKKLYKAKLWVKPWLNFKELQNSSLMVMMPLPLLPLILDAKDNNASGWRKVSGDGLEDTSHFKATDYNDHLPLTQQLYPEINMKFYTGNVDPKVPSMRKA